MNQNQKVFYTDVNFFLSVFIQNNLFIFFLCCLVQNKQGFVSFWLLVEKIQSQVEKQWYFQVIALCNLTVSVHCHCAHFAAESSSFQWKGPKNPLYATCSAPNRNVRDWLVNTEEHLASKEPDSLQHILTASLSHTYAWSGPPGITF